MGMPRKLKHMNLFNDGQSYIGEIIEVKLPTLTRKMEDHRAGGMNGPVQVDFGMEGMELEWKCGGLMLEPLRQFGISKHDGVLLRFAGAYQRDDGSAVDAVEVVVRGRHKEIEPGTGKPGDDTEFSVKSAVSYFKFVVNGKTEVEIDLVNMVEIIDGVDRLAANRRAIGAA